MALTINTNLSSMIAQRSLNKATNAMNTSIERMTTGYKINQSKDNAAGYSIANIWDAQMSSLDVAADNAATGMDLLTTAEQTYALLTDHLQRIRDLTTQAGNGTYGTASLKAIQSEVYARLQEISRIASNAEFNGVKLMEYIMDDTDPYKTTVNRQTGLTADGINLQVGLYADSDSVINLNIKCFSNATVSGLFSGLKNTAGTGGKNLSAILTGAGLETGDTLNSKKGMQVFAAACAGLIVNSYTEATESTVLYRQDTLDQDAKEMLTFLDKAIADIADRATRIGSTQNRVESAVTALDVQSQNISSSLSTLRDTDVAAESSNYIQQQILQQASATLLSTANQLPSIALNLI